MVLLILGVLLSVQGAKTPSDADCKALGEKIEAALAPAGDVGSFDNDVDFLAMTERALAGLTLDAKTRADWFPNPGEKLEMGSILRKGMDAESTYTFLRVRKVGAETRLLFRMWSEKGLNYHEYLVETLTSGKGIRIVDWYPMSLGELMSQTLRRNFLTTMAAKPGGIKGSGGDAELYKQFGKLEELRKLRQENRFRDVLTMYDGLPAAWKKDKFFMLHRVIASGQVGEAEAAKAMEDFRKAYPNDPATDLLCIDSLFLLKKYDEVIQALDRIDKSIGGDVYTHLMKANVCVLAGRLPDGKKHARKAVELDKEFEDAYWVLVTIGLQEKNHKETLQWLSVLEKDLGVELADLAQTAGYEEVVKSPEYKAWMEKRKKR